MELQETVQMWKNKGALMFLFRDTVEKKPTDFMSKFLSGQDQLNIYLFTIINNVNSSSDKKEKKRI